jgi:putative ABC transport system permease protein
MDLPVWIENRGADLRYALRMMRKTPGTTTIAVMSLALGIGANTAIFSLVDAMLLKLLPVKSPQELYLVAANPARPNTSWNYPDYVAFRDHNSSFSGLAAYTGGNGQPVGMQLDGTDAGSTTELAYAAAVSGNYFEVLGVGPAIGSLLTPEGDRAPGESPYIVLSYDYWQSRFTGDPEVIGRKVRLNGYPFTIVGVSRRGFSGADVTASPNMFIPIMMRSEVTGVPFAIWNTRHYWWMQTIGRIKSGATVAQAETELYAVYQDQEEGERRSLKDGRFVNQAQPILLMPAARGYSYVRNRLQRPLIILMIVVGLVLVIACANVANLMLARGAARQREMAVRLAVGASRSQLTAQLLVESIAIALAGGVAGLAFAFFCVRVLLDYLPQTGWGQASLNVTPDLRLLGFTFAVSLITGVLYGIAPALKSTKPDLVRALKEDSAGSSGPSRLTLSNALVVIQVALSLVLLIGTGLFVRSLGNLHDIDSGFRADNTVIVTVDPSRNGYKGQRLRDFYEKLRLDVETLPGVQSVSLANITPLSGSRWNGSIAIEGYQWKDDEKKYVDMNAVGPRYFETVGIPLILGRDFRDEDNPPYSLDPPEKFTPGVEPPEPPGPRVAIINQSFANRFFEGRNPIGMHVSTDEQYKPDRAFEIVGVVKDAHYFGLREALEPMMYFPVWRQAGSRALCIRTSKDAPQLAAGIRRQVTAIDAGIPVLSVRSMHQEIDNDILVDRLIATLSSYFGLLALLLAGVGLYGVISYGVTRRTREIGIRMALGAQRPAVLWLVMRRAAAFLLIGAVIGIPTALFATRLVKSFLYGIGAQDPMTIVMATLVLGAVAATASFLPARRATKVDPMVALRHE